MAHPGWLPASCEPCSCEPAIAESRSRCQSAPRLIDAAVSRRRLNTRPTSPAALGVNPNAGLDFFIRAAVKETVSVAQATSDEAVFPERVQEALGRLVGAAKEGGLPALSVGVGLGVLSEMMEEEVDEVMGPKGKHDPDRTAVRHGHEDGEVTLGGRRVKAKRPRVRAVDGEAEVKLWTY